MTRATTAAPLHRTMNTVCRFTASRHGSVARGVPPRGVGVVVGCDDAFSSSSPGRNTQQTVRGASRVALSSRGGARAIPLFIRPSSFSDRSKLRRRAAMPPPCAVLGGDKTVKVRNKNKKSDETDSDNNSSSNASSSRFRPIAKKQNRWTRVSQLMEEEATADIWGAYRINTYATAERYSLSLLASRIRMSEARGWGRRRGGLRVSGRESGGPGGGGTHKIDGPSFKYTVCRWRRGHPAR